eukprot:TRINITY_DN35573_c0_g1_i2.p3 TRINITY_DN35573_c0_g1~~TRINITY_DN35573_c0_g1_i2.p3  ORF type:complete len:207 (+),score=23.95 TRINITY_DN35573_c0_g1_i2:178-798(+)
MNGPNTKFKIVLLGEGRVGKTSLLVRFVQDKFPERQSATTSANFLSNKLQLESGREVELFIWDTAGQEKFHSLSPIYYRGAHGALLVFDILNWDSLQRVEKWVRELRAMEGPQLQIVLVGNKQDMDRNRAVTEEQAKGMAKLIGAPYVGTSAKTGDGVQQAFSQIAELIVANHPDATNRESEFKGTTFAMQIQDDQSLLQPRSTCC